ncbi:ABC transporter substrate-binding protein [Paenibacillus foliorum]|nr:extracellular solute-binding protein [Paenibacillus foliorum]
MNFRKGENKRGKAGQIMLRTVLGISVLCMVAGCNKTTDPAAVADNTAREEQHNPVTISVGIKSTGYLSDEEFDRYFVQPVKKKHPWITLSRVTYTNNSLAGLVTAEQTPDIIISNNVNGMPQLEDLKLLESIEGLIKKHKLDVSTIEPEALEAIKSASQKAELVALPYSRNFGALYYNKDIFDRFGVPYPKDGMTWAEVAELAKLVTRNENGVTYRGLEPNVPERLASQLSLPLVDTKTEKTVINSDQWKKVLSQVVDIYRIPGNSQITTKSKGDDLFTKGTLAMIAEINIIFDAGLDKLKDLNWDIVSFPTWPEAPGVGIGPDEHLMVLTTTSKNKDDAFRVMAAVLSNEVQLDLSKNGRFSVLKDEGVKKAFGSNMDFMKTRNIQAVYKTSLAKPYQPTLYDTAVINVISKEMTNMVTSGKDINSALRDAEEMIDKNIQSAKSK